MTTTTTFPTVEATADQIREARRLRRLGWSYAGIRKRFGLQSDAAAAVLVGDKPDNAGRS